MIDLTSISVVYSDRDFIQSELSFIQFQPAVEAESAKIYTLNMDQNLAVFEVKWRESSTKAPKIVLSKVSSRCYYLDEVIDLKFFKPNNDYALMCSNSETLKLLDLKTGVVELYKAHTDIILCLDINSATSLCLTGAKDNSVLLWRYNLDEVFQRKLQCVAKYLGHAENISCVYFAPKKTNFFCTVSQDNTLKIWPVEK